MATKKKTPPKAAKKTPRKPGRKKGVSTYDVKELEAQALEEITKRKLIFVDEAISYLPCSSSTFYAKNLEKSEAIKSALNKNKVDLKAGLRKKWYESGNATTDIALYKLLGTEDEAHRLNGSKQVINNKHSGSVKIEGETLITPDED